MQFQFQYSASDLKAIRDADDRVYYSPSSTITVWALGFAVCMLVLGAVGAWSLLSIIAIFCAIFVTFYVYVLSRRNQMNRETLVRTVEINESGIKESYRNTEFLRTWPAFQQAYELGDQFLFHHYSTVLAVPKRVIPVNKLDDLRALIDHCFENESMQQTVPQYATWFSDDSEFGVYKFSWTKADVEKIYEAKMKNFDRTKTITMDKVDSGGMFGSLWPKVILSTLGLVLMAGCIFWLSTDEELTDPAHLIRLVFVPVALSCPFLLGYLWWRYITRKSRQTPPNFPTDEIAVKLTKEHLLAGFEKAVSRYSWEDIKSFMYSEQFVGFVPQNGRVHVISNRAFGSLANALEFLRLAEQLQSGVMEPEKVRNAKNASTTETGNPYQPPPV